MYFPILSVVLSFFIFLSFSGASYGKEAKDCRSYVKSPEALFCIPSHDEEKITQKILKNTDEEIPPLDSVEIVSDNLGLFHK